MMRSLENKKMNLKLKMKILERYSRQGDLAKDIGINECLISRIIHERREPFPDEAQAIAQALGCSVGELFEE
jgi:transcriptional regulator with XRE-family HTH domain